MSKKLWLMMGIAFLLVISFVINPDVSTMDINHVQGNELWDVQVFKEGSTEKGTLALLNVDGVISSETSLTDENVYNHTAFLDALEDAFADPGIKGVILRINSPGGGVYESSEVYTRLCSLKEEYQKPYVVYMEQLAASGGYYISLPADRIYANKNTLTGSIGVIISAINYEKLAENLGIKELVFKSGPNKDMLSPMREVTPEEAAIMNSILDEYYNDLLEAFMLHRRIESKELAVQLADGRIYTARQAKAKTIIDEVGTMDEAIQGLSDLAGLKDPKILEYVNHPVSPFDKLMGFAARGPALQWIAGKLGTDMSSANLLQYASDAPYLRAMYMSNWKN